MSDTNVKSPAVQNVTSYNSAQKSKEQQEAATEEWHNSDKKIINLILLSG